jgi:hypothetical protein
MAPHEKDQSVAALLNEAADDAQSSLVPSGAKSDEPWPNFYARHLREQFASS